MAGQGGWQAGGPAQPPTEARTLLPLDVVFEGASEGKMLLGVGQRPTVEDVPRVARMGSPDMDLLLHPDPAVPTCPVFSPQLPFFLLYIVCVYVSCREHDILLIKLI